MHCAVYRADDGLSGNEGMSNGGARDSRGRICDGVVVTFDGAPTLAVEVADTPQARALGLMHRTEVRPGTGMLFVFPSPSVGGFWMKNTLVPLSIAYIRDDRVVSTAEMVPCPPATAACPAYAAAAAYTSAVEAPAGFFPAHGVGPGTRVSVQGPTAMPQ